MQPTQDYLSTGRRALDVEDYIDIVRRHKSWIVGPAFAALVLSVVGAFLWPDTYISESSVQVVPPQVPERYVSSNINSEMSQRIQSMAQEIISRPQLTTTITTYDLYRRERESRPMEDVIEKMKRDIGISPVGQLAIQNQRMPISAFRVSFKYSDRFKAQKVTQDLVGRFISENTRKLYNQSAATTEFLKDQWDAARKHLEDMEAKITAFRVRNAGRLPDQMGANLQSLQALQSQLMGVNDAISRTGQDKLLLENQLRIYRDQLRNAASGNDDLTFQVKSDRLVGLERDITTAEMRLAAARERYRDTHPDIKALQAELEMCRSRRDSLVKEEELMTAQTPARTTPAVRRTSQQLEAMIASLEGQFQAKNLEMEERQKTQAKLNDLVNGLSGRIQAAPTAEGEYAELTRDYNLAKARYDELNNKKTQSEIATNLENRGQGERLELLEPATVPETPAEPDRILIIAAGLGIGLLAGVFIAGAREMKDTSLKNLKDARAYTGLPVLGTIPLLENDLVVRRKRRLTWVAWSAACIVGLVAMTSSIYYYYYVTKV
jgi:polysaccharide chain length determinant protein (PEP-CTERM system associated)